MTLAPNWFNRRENLESRTGSRWASAAPSTGNPQTGNRIPASAGRAWLDTYRGALRRAGFRYQLHFQVVPKTNLPLYLVYGTNSDRASRHEGRHVKVDANDGIGFADPRTRGAPLPGQQTLLWGGPEHPELLELVQQRLKEGPVSLEELKRWLLFESARWRARDAAAAVRELLDMGVASVEPPGKLTRDSVIRLR